jgi:DNA-directed RNA polymerase subunit RPC12/RpoP
MRIIKMGDRRIKIHELICVVCGTIFEVEEKEATSDSTCNEDQLFIECPVCNYRVYFFKREN